MLQTQTYSMWFYFIYAFLIKICDNDLRRIEMPIVIQIIRYHSEETLASKYIEYIFYKINYSLFRQHI